MARHAARFAVIVLYEATAQVDHRDVFAEVAPTRLNDISDGDGIRRAHRLIRHLRFSP